MGIFIFFSSFWDILLALREKKTLEAKDNKIQDLEGQVMHVFYLSILLTTLEHNAHEIWPQQIDFV